MKPLKQKAYGHIPHLPGSRLGPADRHCHEGQAKIATEKVRDRLDVVIVQEKFDGSCCAVAKVDGKILPLGRAGYLAWTSEFSVHHSFALYVKENQDRFDAFLNEGERVVGEYLAQAVGTRYELLHEPFVIFDIMKGSHRLNYKQVARRASNAGFTIPNLVGYGEPVSVKEAIDYLSKSGHGAIDPVEGAIWRVERNDEVDFLVKYVRHDKEDGKYFPERNNGEIIWNCKEYIP
jgi:ATP-dependent RNA circularization protein (DNA/RNA ligase family)